MESVSKQFIKHFVLTISAFLVIFASTATARAQAILFQDDSFATIDSDNLIIDNNNTNAGNISLQFGATLAKTLLYSQANSRFELNAGLDLGNYQLSTARVENVAVMPGGAGGLTVSDKGRIVQLTATDGIAPGCTGPSCASGSYTWDGSTWRSLQGSITTSNATKIVTVGPTGRDYTTIAGAATYLNTLSGGEMWVDPGTFPVSTAVNLANIKIRGADTALTTIDIGNGGAAGKLQILNSKFETLTVNVQSGITDTMGMDVLYNASFNSAVEFSQVNFIVNGAKIGIDSSSASPKPITIATFNQCTESAGTGTLLTTQASSNLNTSSLFTVINLLSTSPLKLQNWPVTIIGGSNVVTSGTLTSVPDRTILVSPGMNIQGAINSLGASGGVIKLLVGTHDITTSILVNNNNIMMVGEGPGTILRAQAGTWTGGTTVDDCAIQVGLADGTAPRNNVIIQEFQVQVGANTHGVCVNGGYENKVLDMSVLSTGVKSGSGPKTAIVFTDGAIAVGTRFTASRNIVSSDVATNRWNDGVHFDGNAIIAGQIYGYGNGITDSIISEMQVNEATETSYAFSAVSGSGIFSNRARNIGYSAGSLGLFLSDCQDVAVINNSIEGNNNASSQGIYLYGGNTDATIIGNMIRGGPSNFANGIDILTGSTANSRIMLEANQFENVATRILDNGVSTKNETMHVRAVTNPLVTDDISKNYGIGTMWINTATDTAFVSANSTTGAAVWVNLSTATGLPGTTSNNFTLDTDNTGGNVTLQFGQTLAKTLVWDATNNRFNFNDAVDVSGVLSTQRGAVTAVNGSNNSTNNNLAIPNATFVRVTGPTLAFTIAGITGGYNGRILILLNSTAQNMTIANQSGNAIAANRIITNTGASVVTTGTGTVILIYDNSVSRWQVISLSS